MLLWMAACQPYGATLYIDDEAMLVEGAVYSVNDGTLSIAVNPYASDLPYLAMSVGDFGGVGSWTLDQSTGCGQATTSWAHYVDPGGSEWATCEDADESSLVEVDGYVEGGELAGDFDLVLYPIDPDSCVCGDVAEAILVSGDFRLAAPGEVQ